MIKEYPSKDYCLDHRKIDPAVIDWDNKRKEEEKRQQEERRRLPCHLPEPLERPKEDSPTIREPDKD